LDHQDFAWINKLIIELLAGHIAKNTTYNRKNMYSKIINIAGCKQSKKRLLEVELLILILYNYPTAKTRALYKCTFEPAGRLDNNRPNSEELRDHH
jgi:hypothetical protein